MDLRRAAQRARIARLLLLGLSSEKIGDHLGCTARTVRYVLSSAAFKEFYATLERDHFDALDRRSRRLLELAIHTLQRQLRDPDWRCRASAIEMILKVHGRYTEKLDLSGNLQHTGAIAHAHQHQLKESDMTDEQRTAARVFLQSLKSTQPRALPPAFTRPHPQTDQDA